MLRTAWFAVLIVFSCRLFAQEAPVAVDPARLLQTVDYIAVDYPGAIADGVIISEAEYAEMQEFAQALLDGLSATAAPQRLLDLSTALSAAIAGKESPDRVFAAAVALRAAMLQQFPIVTLPRQAPNLELAHELYTAQCAGCHGSSGHGDGIAGRTLDPAPTDFTDAERAATRSLYGLYNTITLGVADTGMVAFTGLSDHERWSLAFFVAGFHNTPAQIAAGTALWPTAGAAYELASVATATELELRTTDSHAGELLAYLRAHPEAGFADAEDPLAIARRLVADSERDMAAGNRNAAYDTALKAYLDGVELAEPSLAAVNRDIVREIEEAMIAHRSAIKEGADADEVTRLAAEVDTVLARAGQLLANDSLSPTLTFTSSFVILAREGLEAILLIAAMALFIRRSGDGSMLPLHAGWTIAIVAGFATWVFSNWVITISGAAREVTEGLTALVAAVVLIWVGIWMHQQMALQDWTRNVTSRMHSAVKNQSPWWIFFLSFIAVYREMFETILFYQALWLQIDAGSRGALFGGAGVALLLLLGIVWAMFKLGARLPVRQFFRVCAITLVVMAVIFVGKGIAALQEAGHLPLHSVTFPRIDLLGIYPSLEGVVAQIVVAAMAVFALTRRAAPPTPRPAAS